MVQQEENQIQPSFMQEGFLEEVLSKFRLDNLGEVNQAKGIP